MFARHVPTSHPFRVLRCSSPRRGLSYRLTLPSPRSLRASRLSAAAAGKIRLTNFCNRFSKTSTWRTFDSRGERRTRAQRITYDGTKAPAYDSGEGAVDVAPTASDNPHSTFRSRRSSLERRTILVVPPIEGSSCDAPPSRRFQPRTGSADQPLTSPVIAPARGRNPWLIRPEPLPPPPRQRTTVFPAQDAFHRRVLARPHLRGASSANPPPGTKDFAVPAGLPTLLRLPQTEG